MEVHSKSALTRVTLQMINRRKLIKAVGATAVAIASNRASAARSQVGYPRVMNGPMVGAPSPKTITIWVRVSGPYDVVLEVSSEDDPSAIVYSESVRARHENDFCVCVTARDLTPNAVYRYRVMVNGSLDRYLRGQSQFRTKTAYETRSHDTFTIGFGSCARYQIDPVQKIWGRVQEHNPDLFFWLGDNMYADSTEPAILVQEWRRQRDVVSMQAVSRSIPQLAIWDDHDYGLNDHDKTNPLREQALHIFKKYWANPGYGLVDAPGVFFKYGYGPVDFFFLDVRYHRDPNTDPDTSSKSMLGAIQKTWLKDSLKASDAIFKIIISGSGWSNSKGPGGDSWASFLSERNELFDYIRDEKVEGVLLLSGDTHIGELNAIPWSENGGYDMYDLVSSPLAQNPSDSWADNRPELRIRKPESTSANFGLLSFEFHDRPVATFKLIDEFGRYSWSPFKIYADELKNGVTSWSRTIDPVQLKRQKKSI